jgi:hypothetical protein
MRHLNHFVTKEKPQTKKSGGLTLYETSEDERAFHCVGAAALAPTAILVGLDIGRVVASGVHADAGGDTIRKGGFQQFLQRFVALISRSFSKLVM